jgi:hypothetical protein
MIPQILLSRRRLTSQVWADKPKPRSTKSQLRVTRIEQGVQDVLVPLFLPFLWYFSLVWIPRQSRLALFAWFYEMYRGAMLGHWVLLLYETAAAGQVGAEACSDWVGRGERLWDD